ncbi:rhoptry neck protein 2, putative [Eimeria brunetti]|uniref:Rhoptry neck protein 2, putative n=1 Tax=Eimeria brunetti TaxID=51314 RepID=U6LCK5_9EIME|nr:rhoptry neck protein 2, putative [Eimeria brunetti]
MGVKVNIEKVMGVMKAVNSAAEVAKGAGVYRHLREAAAGGGSSSSSSSSRREQQAAAAAGRRNPGFLSLDPEFVFLSEKEREREFQERTSLSAQAPYYGDFIVKWIEERKEARKKALFAMLTLGFFFAYTFLSVSDITQHLHDSGLGPAVDCLENLVVGPICPAAVVAPAISSAAAAAAQDVFKVGILGLLTPYLVWPMMLVSVWQILKSEFKVLLQFEMGVKSLFSRFSRWAKQPFKNWWQQRKRIKETILQKANLKYQAEKDKNKGKEPMVHDFVHRSNFGEHDLDLLGIPAAAPPAVSYEITWGAPVFPFSPPLIQPGGGQ